MELVIIVAIFSVVGVLLSVVTGRQKRMTEQARLLEEALKNPNVDRATVEALAYQLTGRRPLRMEPKRGSAMALVLALGWLAMFTGIGLLIGAKYYAASYSSDDMWIAGWIVGLIGFALVSYPFALRELEMRRAA